MKEYIFQLFVYLSYLLEWNFLNGKKENEREYLLSTKLNMWFLLDILMSLFFNNFSFYSFNKYSKCLLCARNSRILWYGGEQHNIHALVNPEFEYGRSQGMKNYVIIQVDFSSSQKKITGSGIRRKKYRDDNILDRVHRDHLLEANLEQRKDWNKKGSLENIWGNNILELESEKNSCPNYSVLNGRNSNKVNSKTLLLLLFYCFVFIYQSGLCWCPQFHQYFLLCVFLFLKGLRIPKKAALTPRLCIYSTLYLLKFCSIVLF